MHKVSSVVLLTVQKGNKVLKIVEITAGYSKVHEKKRCWRVWHESSSLSCCGKYVCRYIHMYVLGLGLHMACKCGKLRH